MYRTDFWTLREKARVGCFERTTSKHVYYQVWNRSPAQAGCMRQVLGPGALGRPTGIRWRGRWEGRSGWGIHVTPWLIQVNVWQNPLQYCHVISLQLIKINEKKKGKLTFTLRHHFPCWIACQLWLFLGKHDYSPIIHTFKQAISATKSESNSVKNVNFTFIWREYKMPNLIPCCTAGMLWN